MGLRDQFDRLRNYFVDDEDEDYEEVETEEVSVSEPQIQAQPQPAPQPRPQVVRNRPQAVSQPRPAQQQTVQPSYTNRRSAAGTNSSYAYVASAPQPQATVTRTTAATSLSTIQIKEPHVYQDIMDLGAIVKNGQSVLVNFKNMADQQARRSIDFLTGVAYIVDGDIQNIGGQIFLVTPTGVSVEGAKESMLSNGMQGMDNFELSY